MARLACMRSLAARKVAAPSRARRRVSTAGPGTRRLPNAHQPLDTPTCNPRLASHSDKVASDCLRATGWSVEAGIEFFYASGLQGSVPAMDARAIESLFDRYKGARRRMGPRTPHGAGREVAAAGIGLRRGARP